MSDQDRILGAQGVYERSGIGGRAGFGERAALLVVDFQKGFTNPESPVGGDLTEEISATASLLEVGRAHALPVAYTAVGFDPGLRDGATWLRKMPGLSVLVDGSEWCEIDERVAPRPGEPVWVKRASSAFFGTPLISFLTAARVDTLIVTGCVTSGCIRATTIDAVSWGYRTIVPQECVGDRAPGPHDWNLFDIDSKYADVMPLAEVLEHLARANGKVATA
ncbi:MAG TPA: isochorismatase family protein [Solirubrobacteraceae bacterium]|jgi:nicotinamidase-related amidase|nr:isochorismatase family protein [Solirubrobacteraceae bacterium]